LLSPCSTGAASRWRMMEGPVSPNRFAQPKQAHCHMTRFDHRLKGTKFRQSAAAARRQRSLVHGLRSPESRVHAAPKQMEKVTCGSLMPSSIGKPAAKMTTSDSHPWRTGEWFYTSVSHSYKSCLI
jgi:hypothetical protein